MSQEPSKPVTFKLLNSAVRTPDQLTGALDLLSLYGLRSAYETLCTKPIPDAIDSSRYFRSIPGDTTIRRGEGMELMQLVRNPPPPVEIKPLDFALLRRAFNFRETPPVSLPESEKGVATVCVKSEDKDGKKHKKKHKKRKHRHKDKEKEKVKEVKVEGGVKKNLVATEGDDHSKKHHKKKRKHETDGSAKK